MPGVTDCPAADGTEYRLRPDPHGSAVNTRITGLPNNAKKTVQVEICQKQGKKLTPIPEESCTAYATGRGEEEQPSPELPPPPTLPLPPNPSAGCYYSSSRGKSEEATVSCQELCIQESPRQLRDVRERVSTVLPAAQPSSLQRLMVTGDSC